jgi:neutral ceramidase
MKRIKMIVLGITLFSALGVCAAGTFRAGAAKGNITPELGGRIVGGFSPFPSTHVHDDLWVRVVVLDDGKTRVALAVCDLIGISQNVSDKAQQLVQEETGLPARNLLVAATHTHSATSARGNRDFSEKEFEMDAYQKFVTRRIADTVRCAINNLAPAQIGWGAASEPRHVFNRRWHMKPGTNPMNPLGGTNDIVRFNPGHNNPNKIKPAGPTDPEICFFALRTPEGKPVALFANYSLHYVGGVRGADISADYFGMFNDRIQQLLGADRQSPSFISILSNGTSGDINNIDFSKERQKLPPYEKMRIVANDVAEKVHAAYRELKWHDHVTVGAAFEELELQLRKPTPEQLAYAKAFFAEQKENAKPDPWRKSYANRIMQHDCAPATWKFPLQAFRIGDVGISCIPFEVFCEIGLELKQRVPFKPSFTVELANGTYGYLPTPRQHALGGYETWLGSNRVEIEASTKIVDRLLEMFTRLQKGE